MSNQLDIQKVNRYDADWDPKTIFTGFGIRAVLANTNDMVTRITNTSRLRKRLSREVGVENEDWILQDHPTNEDVELYLKSSGTLLMWKLQDHQAFSELFDRVEQHVENINEIREKTE